MIMIFGTLLSNDDISKLFLIFIFWTTREVKGKKITQNDIKLHQNDNYIHYAPYLRKSIACDHDFYYTFVK